MCLHTCKYEPLSSSSGCLTSFLNRGNKNSFTGVRGSLLTGWNASCSRGREGWGLSGWEGSLGSLGKGRARARGCSGSLEKAAFPVLRSPASSWELRRGPSESFPCLDASEGKLPVCQAHPAHQENEQGRSPPVSHADQMEAVGVNRFMGNIPHPHWQGQSCCLLPKSPSRRHCGFCLRSLPARGPGRALKVSLGSRLEEECDRVQHRGRSVSASRCREKGAPRFRQLMKRTT